MNTPYFPHVAYQTPSIASRVLGAGMAFVFAAASVLSLPWLLGQRFSLRLGWLLGLPVLFFYPLFYVWVLFVALAALVIGFRVGSYDTMDMFNLIWGTGETSDVKVREMAESLRSTSILSAVGAVVLLGLRWW